MKLGIKEMKKMFLDRSAVQGLLDKQTRSAFGRFGAYVRTVARNSIKKRKGPSSPGSPPHSHIGHLKRFIYYAYNAMSRSVVIGPALLPRKRNRLPELVTVPQALEEGGVSKGDLYSPKKKKVVAKRVKIKPRPYMAPAFEIGKQKLPALWQNSIH